MNEHDVKGLYRHYKGASYEVLEVGTHTETNEKVVIYKSTEAPYAVWVRPLAMFFETIDVDGVSIPRFSKID